MAAVSTDWVLLSLAPAPPERVRAWFDGAQGLDVRVPAVRSSAAVRDAIGAADIRRRTPR